MFFESLAECSLSFTYVCVATVDVTCDVIVLYLYIYYRSSTTWTRGLEINQIGGEDGEKDRPMGKS